MKKIGIVFTAFNMEEYLLKSIWPWVAARECNLLDYKFIISAVSVPFLEYKDFKIKKDKTQEILETYKYNNNIDYLFSSNDYYTESDARNKALEPLLKENCEAIWIIDADEMYQLENIENILKYIELEKFISWFSISYKNYVFDERTYLKDAFTPPRIFRVNTNGYKLSRFFWDNDLCYFGVANSNNEFQNKEISYKVLPMKIIPKRVAFVPHFTWLSNEKSRLKVEYQKLRGWKCSYLWNYKDNKLEFNPIFNIPEVLREE